MIKKRYLFQRRIKHVLFQRVALALLLKLIRRWRIGCYRG
ncbi:hypothetical protein Gohar_027171 [Gossypium harknessii]|uniref:Uncharacterized protein n=1 Tax=Gossypium harknessii TaxID=34285 RepID=A0A7J9HUL1_9ROSI|nr:hypothetical protein [Gossypium harknessii]